jgi:hypothetical protein
MCFSRSSRSGSWIRDCGSSLHGNASILSTGKEQATPWSPARRVAIQEILGFCFNPESAYTEVGLFVGPNWSTYLKTVHIPLTSSFATVLPLVMLWMQRYINIRVLRHVPELFLILQCPFTIRCNLVWLDQLRFV